MEKQDLRNQNKVLNNNLGSTASVSDPDSDLVIPHPHPRGLFGRYKRLFIFLGIAVILIIGLLGYESFLNKSASNNQPEVKAGEPIPDTVKLPDAVESTYTTTGGPSDHLYNGLSKLSSLAITDIPKNLDFIFSGDLTNVVADNVRLKDGKVGYSINYNSSLSVKDFLIKFNPPDSTWNLKAANSDTSADNSVLYAESPEYKLEMVITRSDLGSKILVVVEKK
jgi:hypothetical protein